MNKLISIPVSRVNSRRRLRSKNGDELLPWDIWRPWDSSSDSRRPPPPSSTRINNIWFPSHTTTNSRVSFNPAGYVALLLQLTVTVHPTVITNDTTSASCRDRFGSVDVTTFRRRACTLCFVYLFSGVGGLTPSYDNYTSLVRLNGSTVVQRYIVDSADVASLDAVCRQCASDIGGEDGCARWTRCCSKAEECCQRQRHKVAGSRPHETSSDVIALAGCPATWDGFSCWDVTPAGTVVHQQCPQYMLRTELTGLWPISSQSAINK